MPRPTKEQVFDQIKDAVVAVVAAKGIGAASVGEIAKAAKVSPGTIYLHFENKDDMLQQVYLRIKYEFHATLMTAADAGTAQEVMRRMWMNLFDFLHRRPNDFLYLEYAGAAQVLTDEQRAEVAPLQEEVNTLVQTTLDRASMASVSLDVAVNLLIGPAMHLARKAVLSGAVPERAEIDQTFTRVWASLRM